MARFEALHTDALDAALFALPRYIILPAVAQVGRNGKYEVL